MAAQACSMLATDLLAAARRQKERASDCGVAKQRRVAAGVGPRLKVLPSGGVAPAGVIGLSVPEAGGNSLGRLAIGTRQFQRARPVVTETPVKLVIIPYFITSFTRLRSAGF